MKKQILFLAASMCLGASVASAGPNAGGTLIVSVQESIVYCTDTTTYCPNFDLANCQSTDNSASGSATKVFYVVAAFPTGSNPRLAGLTFGVQYTSNVTLVGQASCADFELTTSNWPDSGSGTALTWNSARTTLLTPAYWFAGYNYYSPDAGPFGVIAHPTQGGNFADDSVPAKLDEIAAYGSLGFDTQCSTPCPVTPVLTGACCFPTGGCTILSAADCATAGGAYQGDNTTCSPNPCPLPTGACCFADGSCLVNTANDCAGIYQGDFTSCDPNPCTLQTGVYGTPDGRGA